MIMDFTQNIINIIFYFSFHFTLPNISGWELKGKGHVLICVCVRGSGAAEGDASGMGDAGGGAALQHILPGHPADHPHPAGPHPAKPADRLCTLAQPG